MFFQRLALSGLILLFVVSVGVSLAPTHDEIAQAIRQLGDERFVVREQASQFLRAAGSAAEPALEAALGSGDAEVARRAGVILERFKYGIYPDTPPAIVECVRRFRSGAAGAKEASVADLLKLGSPGYAVVLKLTEAEDNMSYRATLFQQLVNEAPGLAATLLSADHLDTIEILLEKTVLLRQRSGVAADDTIIRDYAAFLLLRGNLDKKITQWSGPQWAVPAPRRGEVLAYLHRANGDRTSATRAAVQSGDRGLQKWLLWEQSQWRELLDNHPPRADLLGRNEIEILGYQAAYQRLTGQARNFAKTLARIRQLADGNKNDSTESWFNAKALLLNDRPQDAIEVLIGAQRYGSAFEILKGQMRVSDALALADKVKGQKHDDVFQLATLRAEALYEVGEKQKALALIAQLGEDLKGVANDPWPRYFLIGAEHKMGLVDQALAHAAESARGADNGFQPQQLLFQLFGYRRIGAEIWWKFLRSKFAEEDRLATMKRLHAVMEGTINRQDLVMLTGSAADWVRAARALTKKECQERLHVLADTCLEAGLPEQAVRYLEEAALVAGDATAQMRLADYWAEQKQWRKAATLYGQAWQQDKQAPVPLFLQGRALVQAGDAERGENLMKLARWLPPAREQGRHELAEMLDKRGLNAEARRAWELIARVGGLDSWSTNNAQMHLASAAAAQGRFLEAAARRELSMLPCLARNTGYLETTTFLRVPHRVHLERARGLLADRKVEEALQEIQVCLNMLPGDVDTAIVLVPLLAKSGRQRDADKLFGTVGAAVCRFPALGASAQFAGLAKRPLPPPT